MLLSVSFNEWVGLGYDLKIVEFGNLRNVISAIVFVYVVSVHCKRARVSMMKVEC